MGEVMIDSLDYLSAKLEEVKEKVNYKLSHDGEKKTLFIYPPSPPYPEGEVVAIEEPEPQKLIISSSYDTISSVDDIYYFFEELGTPIEIILEEYVVTEEDLKGILSQEVLALIERKLTVMELVRRFMAIQPIYYDDTQVFWAWDKNNKIWRKVDEAYLLMRMYYFTQWDGIVSRGIKSQILDSFKILGKLRKPQPAKPTWIQFVDEIWDVETGEKIEPSPQYFIKNVIPWKPKEGEFKTIDKLFTDWVGEENKQILYEIVAYAMLPDYPLHKVFVLLGSGRNGKSSFVKILRRVLGSVNVTSTDLKLIENSRFETARLKDKLVALIMETDFEAIRRSAMLKALTGQDEIPYEHKHKTPSTFINYAKILIATNNLPYTEDTTDAFFSRMIIVDFPRQFPNRGDIIKSIPNEEYEALVYYLYFVLQELLKRGQFHNEGDIEEKRRRYLERSAPILKFLKDVCEITYNPEDRIPTQELYNSYLKWFGKQQVKTRVLHYREFRNQLTVLAGLDVSVGRLNNEVSGVSLVRGIKYKSQLKGQLMDQQEDKSLEDRIKDFINSRGEEVPITEVISHFKEEGYDEKVIEDRIRTMLKLGMLMEIKAGYVMVV